MLYLLALKRSPFLLRRSFQCSAARSKRQENVLCLTASVALEHDGKNTFQTIDVRSHQAVQITDFVRIGDLETREFITPRTRWS